MGGPHVHGRCHREHILPRVPVSVARERLPAHGDAIKAGCSAGYTLFRPVVNDGRGMIVGMIPWRLGLGDGVRGLCTARAAVIA